MLIWITDTSRKKYCICIKLPEHSEYEIQRILEQLVNVILKILKVNNAVMLKYENNIDLD